MAEHSQSKDVKATAAERFFKGELAAINIGLASFAEDLAKQGVEVLHVEWHPPAGGDAELLALLDQLM